MKETSNQCSFADVSESNAEEEPENMVSPMGTTGYYEEIVLYSQTSGVARAHDNLSPSFTISRKGRQDDQYTCVEFNNTGELLAVGDRGGRITVFKSNPEQNSLYNIYCAFTSHEPEFDYLKSLEIEEKINSITWLGKITSAHHLLSANDKTVKLWRLSERHHVAYNFNNRDDEGTSITAKTTAATVDMYPASDGHSDDVYGPAVPHLSPAQLRVPQFRKSQHLIVEARLRRVFSNAHTYHINAISLNSDQETFLSADDLRINLWNLDVSDQSFTIVDLKPPNMEDLMEVVTCARFHPSLCHLLAYSTSRGVVRLCDLRTRALCDNHVLAFEDPRSSKSSGFFADIIGSLSDFRFSHSGQYVLARDYLNLKVWDIRMGICPCEVYPVHEPFRSQLCMLYENDAIFDKFMCYWSKDDHYLITGSYGRTFRIFDRHSSCDSLYSLPPGQPGYRTSSPNEADGTEEEQQRQQQCAGVSGGSESSLPAGGMPLGPLRFICPNDPIGTCLGLNNVHVAPAQLVDHLLVSSSSGRAIGSPESCQSRATTGSRTSRSTSSSSSSAGGSGSGIEADEMVTKAMGEATLVSSAEMAAVVAGGDTAAQPSVPPSVSATAHPVGRERRSRRKSPHQVCTRDEPLDGTSGAFRADENRQSNGHPTVVNGGGSGAYSLTSTTSLDGDMSEVTTGEAGSQASSDRDGVTDPASADKSALAVDMLQLRRRIATLQSSAAYNHHQQTTPAHFSGEEATNTAEVGTTNGVLSLPGIRQLDCHCKLLHMTWHPDQLIAAAILGNRIYVINKRQSDRESILAQPSSASPLLDETVGLPNMSLRCDQPDVEPSRQLAEPNDGEVEYGDGESEDDDGEYDYEEETEEVTAVGEVSIGCPPLISRSADGEKGSGDYTQQQDSSVHPATGAVVVIPQSPPIRLGKKRRRRQVPNGECSLNAEASGCSSPKKDAPGPDSDSATMPPLLFLDEQTNSNGLQQTEEIPMDCDKTEAASSLGNVSSVDFAHSLPIPLVPCTEELLLSSSLTVTTAAHCTNNSPH